MTLEELQVLITAETRGLKKELDGVKKQLGGVSSEVQATTEKIKSSFKGLAAALATLGIGVGIKSAVKDAMAFEAAVQQIQRLMGNSAGAFHKWANENAAAFGMARSEAVRYGAIYANLLSGFTNGTAQTAKYTEDLLKASAAVASRSTFSMENTMERIRSGLLGNTEAIEDLGINVGISLIESTKAFERFANGKSWDQLNFKTQQTIRYFAILEQVSEKYGLEIAQNTTSRQAAFTAQLKDAQLALGQAFLPIYNIVLPALTQMATALATVMRYVAAFSQALFGSSGSNQAQQTKATEQQAAAVSGVGDAYKEAGKKAKGALAGFDEVNQLTEPSGGAAGGSAAAGTPDMGAILDAEQFDTNAIPSKVQEVADSVKVILNDMWNDISDVGGKVGEAFSGIGPALQPIFDAKEPIMTAFGEIGRTAGQLMDEFLKPLADYLVLDFIPTIVTGFVESFAPVFADLLVWSIQEFAKTFQNVTDSATGLWSEVWVPALEDIKNAFSTAMPQIAGSLQNLLDGTIKPLNDYLMNEFFLPISEEMTKTFAPIFSDILVWAIEEFAKTFENTVNTINDLYENSLFPNLEKLKNSFLENIPRIGESFQSLLDGTLKPFVDYFLNEFVLPISSSLLETIIPIIADTAVWALNEFASTFEWAANLMNEIYNTVIQPVFELIKSIVMDTLNIVKGLWEKHGKTLLDNLSELFKNLRNLFQKLWDDILKPIIQPFLEMLSWLWDKHLKGLVEQVGDFIMKLVNGALEIFNKFIMPIVNYLIDILAPGFTEGFRLAINIVGSAIAAISDILSGFFKVLGGVIDFIVGVFTGDWGKAWGGVRDIFKGVMDSLWGIVKFPLNLIIDGINSMISGLNGLSIDIPDWVPGFGGKSIGFSIPTIPKLARGGIVDGATFMGNYIAGEAGPEMIVPLENTSFVDKLASALGTAVLTAMQFVQGGQSEQGRGDIYLQVDGTTFARLLNPYLDSENGRIGDVMITTT